jgi:hypothetical protein
VLIAVNQNNQRIAADSANTQDTYRCPFCKNLVILKAGSIKIHHFAHTQLFDCKNDDSEMSEWHVEWQKSFGLENAEEILNIGKYFHIADINLNNVVVEFQHSPITYKEAKKRTVFYTQDKRKLFWIFDFRDKYQSRQITIHKPKGYNDLIFKWLNPNNAVLAGLDSRGDGAVTLFIQIQDDKLVEVKWVPYDEKKESESFKYFRGYIRTKQEVIQSIKGEIDLNWKPTPDFEKTDDYWHFEHLLEMIDAGIH